MTEVEKLKKTMHDGMLKAYKQDGMLVPILFYHQNGEPTLTQIPSMLLSSAAGKDILTEYIKKICLEPTTLCAGLVIEAHGVKLNPDEDVEDTEKLEMGELVVSEHPKRFDMIMFIFSTPEKDEITIYEVDPKNKTIGEKHGGEEANIIASRFSEFFKWIKN